MGELDDTKKRPAAQPGLGGSDPNAATRPMKTNPEAAVAPTPPPPGRGDTGAFGEGRPSSPEQPVAPDMAKTVPMERPATLGRPARDGRTVIAPARPEAAIPETGGAGQPPPADAAAAGPSQDDLGLAQKVQQIVKSRTVEKGSEVPVVKLADIIKIVRDMLGGMAGKKESELQDEIVKLRLELDAAKKKLAEAGAGAAAAAEAEKWRVEVERLKGEVERLLEQVRALERQLAEQKAAFDAELAKERAAHEAAMAARAAAEKARADAEERAKQLEGLLGASGKTVAELNAEREALQALVAELEEKARSLRSDVRYAALVEEPQFVEVTAACAEVGRNADKGGPRVGAQARAAGEKIAAAQRTDEPAWKKLMDEMFAKRGTTQVIARLETLSGVHDAMAGEIGRWRRAVGE